jgi:hypothetical protein
MSEENKAVVRRQEEEIFTQGNLDAADEIYARNYVGHDPIDPEDIRGLEAASRRRLPRSLPRPAGHRRGPDSRRGQSGSPCEV